MYFERFISSSVRTFNNVTRPYDPAWFYLYIFVFYDFIIAPHRPPSLTAPYVFLTSNFAANVFSLPPSAFDIMSKFRLHSVNSTLVRVSYGLRLIGKICAISSAPQVCFLFHPTRYSKQLLIKGNFFTDVLGDFFSFFFFCKLVV